MKVLLVNGSPRKNGCTNTALEEVAEALKNNGIETEIFWIGNKAIQGCIACYKCRTTDKGCIFNDDVTMFMEKAKQADGFVFGSPVYYAGPNGSLCAFMDRLFFAYGAMVLKGKVAAAVSSARRAGTTATLDRLNKYFLINQMLIPSSNYWNAVHGSTPEDVKQDLEGLQTMRILGNNMAAMLGAKISLPPTEKKIYTNFARK
ncbi:MAG: flavodoxin family protein [Firmicutes bacterium]|nr:flavodoxin family protein [Bacillota bacterium]